MELSIVIPCYNEADSLAELVERCRQALTDPAGIEVVLVDNGSTENSAAQLSALAAHPEYSFSRIVNVPVNRGYGYGIMSGVRVAAGKTIAWTHADLQTDPADVVAAYRQHRDQLVAGTAIVKGLRVGRPLFDRVFTAGMSAVATAMLGVKISDINAQPKIFSRDHVSLLEHAPDDFSLDVYLLYQARRKGIAIEEYPVLFGDRKHGEPKGGGSLSGKIRLTRRTWAFLRRLRKETRAGLR